MRSRCGGNNGHALMWDATPFGGNVCSQYGQRRVPCGPGNAVRIGDWSRGLVVVWEAGVQWLEVVFCVVDGVVGWWWCWVGGVRL